MLDFTSALYLGLRHGSRSLRPWYQFTTGRPAALSSPPKEQKIAQKLADLMGCERATLAPSTLHLFWDLFGLLADDVVALYVDRGIYPIARWGSERAAALGVPVRSVHHLDPKSLQMKLLQDASKKLKPLVITDGFCPACGRPAPLNAYLKIVRSFGGCLILDDTQALGILGHSRGIEAPYGKGGGGSLRWNKIRGADILVISSLAKGFGVPLAVLAGSDRLIRQFEMQSETRMHCSPPSIAVLRAAEHALAINKIIGDALRLRLLNLVNHFRNQLVRAGFSSTGGIFPVQTLEPIPGINTVTLYERLLNQGIRTIIHRSRNGHHSGITFIITTLHTPDEIEWAVDTLKRVTETNKLIRHKMVPAKIY